MTRELVYALVTVVLVMAALVIATYVSSKAASGGTISIMASTVAHIPAGRWIAIGTGLTSSATLWNLSPPTRATFGYREGNNRLGGRVLTTPHPVLPVSTWTQAMEFGAWAVDPAAHQQSLEYLQALECQSTLQYVNEPACFVFRGGARSAWPALPYGLDSTAAYSTLDSAAELALWARTGITTTAAPDAAVGAILPLAMSPVTVVPTGGGWIDVCLRAVGLTPVQYNQRLRAVLLQPDNTMLLQYESGTHERVQGLLFTGSPDAVLALDGLPDAFHARVRAAFTPVNLGVLYMTFAAQDTWWPALGFVDATAATDTELGLITTAEPGTLRATMYGSAAVNAWTSLLVTPGGLTAAKQRVAALLATVFGQKTLPAPAFLAFRGWPHGVWLWKAGQDIGATAEALSRPFGTGTAAFWACGELSAAFPNRVEGCIGMAKATAAAIEQVVARQRPL